MKLIHIFFAAMAVALAGCQSSSSSSISFLPYSQSQRLMSCQIHLSPEHPIDSTAEIRLVSVGNDSTATIRLDSGVQMSAKPGEYFVCDQFGMHGLELVSTSPESGTAEFKLRWCETR